MAGNFGLEVVVIGFLDQSGKHLRPHRLRNEDAEGVVGPGVLLNLRLAEQFGEPLLQGFQVGADSRPDHDPVRIDGLSVLATSLPGTDRAKEPVFREDPHWSSSACSWTSTPMLFQEQIDTLVKLTKR